MTSIANIAGVEIDLAKVPDSGIPADEKGSHLRGEMLGDYRNADGDLVARAEVVAGPHRDDT